MTLAPIRGLTRRLTLLIGLICPWLIEAKPSIAVSCSAEKEVAEGVWSRRNWTEQWDPAQTAVILCDMWDHHWCPTSEVRMQQLIAPMNEWLRRLRALGVLVIHCPAGTMAFYEGTPQRQRAREAPPVPTPEPLCRQPRDPSREPASPVVHAKVQRSRREQMMCAPWTRQHPDLEIHAEDAIADGPEPYYLLMAEGRPHVLIAGVHTNSCVLGRPFGIRQLTRLGIRPVLVRDLTDGIYRRYEPDGPEHAHSQAITLQHIERYWCPTTTSSIEVMCP